MVIINDKPPNYEEIDKVFGLSNFPTGIIFAWGDTIYNPGGVPVSLELRVHEAVHGHQQRTLGSIERWWRQYIDDKEFRLWQEIPACQAQYQDVCKRVKDRNRRSIYLVQIAGVLSSPLYGSLISHKDAMKILR